MATERPEYRSLGFRLFVFLAVIVNLILTIALLAQVRELQQRVASLPPDFASKRDVAALRPLRIRQIITQNCVDCHSTRRLGVTVSMEPSSVCDSPGIAKVRNVAVGARRSVTSARRRCSKSAPSRIRK